MLRVLDGRTDFYEYKLEGGHWRVDMHMTQIELRSERTTQGAPAGDSNYIYERLPIRTLHIAGLEVISVYLHTCRQV